MQNIEKQARKFHNTYEKLAPKFGYETREDTKEFDANSPNGKLMMAVIEEMLSDYTPNTEVQKAVEDGVMGFAEWLNAHDFLFRDNMIMKLYETYLQSLDKGDK